MHIPPNIIVNADDIGLNRSVNQAILYCFKEGIINSTSLLTNMDYFDEAVAIINNNPVIINIGVHGNFAEGKPLTNFKASQFLTADGKWDINKTNKVLQVLNAESKRAFTLELDAQIQRALEANISITHLDSHLHLHTLPAFYGIFIAAAKKYNLKLRLAQTYREGSFIKYAYRKYINNKITSAGINYSVFFETVDEFLKNEKRDLTGKKVEIMVHPDLSDAGKLFDHVDGTSIHDLTTYLAIKN
jgi:predicted glycoside hydrolase/deacetylase ChbG (UPF0249 family)